MEMQEKIAKLCEMRRSYLASRLSRLWGEKLELHDRPYAEYTTWSALADWMLEFGYEWRKPETGVCDEEGVPIELVRKLKELYYVLIETAVRTGDAMFMNFLGEMVDKIQMAMCDYDGIAYEDFPDAEECARQLGAKELAFYKEWNILERRRIE